ncbi:MAG: tail fiber domain-containing protein [Alphaproteobacteria bacterium]|nr:tail fiber domain-containing protein [Alphaproteobacteria bacterium]
MIRRSERGNVFFTLFGAVAIVGLLGAGIMATMRGPLQTMVAVNQREQAKAEMQIAARLILLETANLATADCEAVPDGYMEPLEFLTASPNPTGGGQLPAVVASNKIDPWGTEYGYCAWDLGPLVDDAGCGGGLQNRLAGPGTDDETPFVLAVISAGPDKTFQTSCSDDPTYVTKSSGADDIVFDYTYGDAIGATGGLWKIKSGQPDVAEISKDLDVTGGATFSGGGTFGDLLSLSAGGLILPDQTTSGACNAANDGVMRRNTTGAPLAPDLEVCYDDGGGYDWESIAGPGSVAGGKWQDGATAGEIYYNAGNVGIGLVDPNFLLDVAGTLNATGAATLGSTLTVTGAGDFDSTLNADGAVTFGSTLDVTGTSTLSTTVINSAAVPLTVQNSGSDALVVEADGDVAIGGGTASDSLDVTGNIHLSNTLKMEDTQAISWGAGTVNITGSTGGALIELNAADTDVNGSANIQDNLVVGGTTTLGNANTDTVSIVGDTTFTNGIDFAVSNLAVSGASCTAANKILKYDGLAWVCTDDAGSGTGGGGGQTIEETLQEGDDANGQKVDNLASITVGSATLSSGDQNLEVDISGDIGAENYCDENGDDCVAGGDINRKIFGTDVDSSLAIDADTTGEILVWNNATTQWEVGDGSDLTNVTATDITFPIDVDGATGGLIMDINAGANNFLSYAGTRNVFLGDGAGDNNTGVRNTFVGYNSGIANTTGLQNAFFGEFTGSSNTTGGNNTFIGQAAGFSNDDANYNTFIGRCAGCYTTSGSNNVFIGYLTGDENTTGQQNTVIGTQAGGEITTGSNNVFLGYFAGINNTTGARNIIIGSNAWNLTAATDDYLNLGGAIHGPLGDQNNLADGGADLTVDGDLTVTGTITGSVSGSISLPIDADDATTPAGVIIDINTGANNFLSYAGTGNLFLGATAGDANSASNGTFIGSAAGTSNTTGVKNTFVGRSAGTSNVNGQSNVFVGMEAGKSNVSGNYNVYIGQNTGDEATGGYNTVIGTGAGGATGNTGTYNTFLGRASGSANTTGSRGTFIGEGSGLANTTGTNNVFLGYRSGQNNADGVSNTFVGYLAGANNTGGDKNIIIGYSVNNLTATTDNYLNLGNALFGTMDASAPYTTGSYTIGGSLNIVTDLTVGDGTFDNPSANEDAYVEGNLEVDGTIYGDGSGLTGVTATASLPIDADTATSPAGVLIDINAGANNLLSIEGTNNVFLGSSSGDAITTAANNVFVGALSGSASTSTSDSVIIGHLAGSGVTTAAGNVIIGKDAGTNSNGDRNTLIGTLSGTATGFNPLTGTRNTYVGYNTGNDSRTGGSNSFFGDSAGELNTTGANNTFLGEAAGDNNTTGSRNIIIGSGADNLTASTNDYLNIGNTVFGDMGTNPTTPGTGDAAITIDGSLTTTSGINAGDDLIVGNGTFDNASANEDAYVEGNLEVDGTIYGDGSGITGVSASVSYPLDADGATSPADVLIDANSGANNFLSFAGTANLFLGEATGDANTTGQNNTFIGSSAGTSITTEISNTFVGALAGQTATGNYNTFIGQRTGEVNTGDINTFVGQAAGISNTSGYENTFIGVSAGRTNTTGYNNTLIGRDAGRLNTSGNSNTFLGHDAGYANTTGASNTFLGIASGDNNTTGLRNILIGANIDNLTASTDDYLNIGNTVFGDMGTNVTTPGTGDAAITIDGDLTITGTCTGCGSGSVSLPIDADTATSPAGVIVSIDSGADKFLYYDSTLKNTTLGDNAGEALSTGDYNTLIGHQAGNTISTGADNTIIGAYAGLSSITTQNAITAIGKYVLFSSTTVNDDITGIGNSALYRVDTVGQGVTAIGSGAGQGSAVSDSITGSTLVGYHAGGAGTGGALTMVDSSFFGYQAGSAGNPGALSHTDSIFIGANVGSLGTADTMTSSAMVVIGNNALEPSTISNGVIIGHEAGDNLTGNNNTMIGYQAGNSVTTGTGNILLGYDVDTPAATTSDYLNIGNAITGTMDNAAPFDSSSITIEGDLTITGTCTGCGGGSLTYPLDTEGEDDIMEHTTAGDTFMRYLDTDSVLAIGLNAGGGITDGDGAQFNVLIGDTAGNALTTGDNNVFVGYGAGQNATTGGGNTLIGTGAGGGVLTGAANVFVGTNSGSSNTSGTRNTFVGQRSGQNNTTGLNNTFLGRFAGYTNTTSSYSTFVGAHAGELSTGEYNAFFGSDAGLVNSTGASNTFLGTQAGVANTTGGSNVFVGRNSGSGNTTGDDNVFIGNSAGANNTGGARNIIIGDATSNLTATTDDYLNIGNTVFGDMGTNPTTPGTGDAAITIDGDLTITGTCTGCDGSVSFPLDADAATSPADVIIDINAGANNLLSVEGTNNVFLGEAAGDAWTTGTNNTFMGYNAGTATTTASNNTFIGSGAGDVNVGGAQNTFLGKDSGGANTSGSGNTFLGHQAGTSNDTTSSNTYVGYFSGRASTGAENTFLGTASGQLSTGSYNTSIGRSAGLNASGNNNTFLGYQAGNSVTTGTDNILLGYDVDTPAATTSNYLNIGNAIYGDMSTDDFVIGSGSASGGQSIAMIAGTATGASSVAIGEATASGDFSFAMGEGGGSATGYHSFSFGEEQDATGSHSFAMHGDASGDYSSAIGGTASGYGSLSIGRSGVSTTGDWGMAFGYDVRAGDGSIDATTPAVPDGTPGEFSVAFGLGDAAGTIPQVSAVSSYGIFMGDQSGYDLSDNQKFALIGGEFVIDSDGSTASSKACIRFNDTSDKLEYSHDCSTYVEMGAATIAFPLDADDATSPTGVIIDINSGANNLFSIRGTNNLFIGETAGDSHTSGSNNTVIGMNAGQDLTTGSGNTFVGRNAGANVTASTNNTVVGDLAGDANMTGTSNTFVGYAAGGSDTSGGNNTFMGQSAGASNTSGSNNVFVGRRAGTSNTNASSNVFVGYHAGEDNTTGTLNTFVGNGAGLNNIGGNYNAFFGTGAGALNTSGNNNVIIGQGSGGSSTTGTDNVFIGKSVAGTNTSGSNNIVIGSGIDKDAAGTNYYLNIGDSIKGSMSTGDIQIVGTAALTVPSGTAAQRPTAVDGMIRYKTDATIGFEVREAGAWVAMGSAASDERLKQNITELDGAEILARLEKVGAYSYQRKDDPERTRYGVVAQQLETIFPELVDQPLDQNEMKTVRYMDLIGPLLASVKELNAENENLRAELSTLQKQNQQTQELLAQISDDVKGLKAKTGYGIQKSGLDLWSILGMLALALAGFGLGYRRKSA